MLPGCHLQQEISLFLTPNKHNETLLSNLDNISHMVITLVNLVKILTLTGLMRPNKVRTKITC